VNPDGSFVYTAFENTSGLDYFRIKVSTAQGESLKATVFVAVNAKSWLWVKFYYLTPNYTINAGTWDWVHYFLRDSARREKISVDIAVTAQELATQAGLDKWRDRRGKHKQGTNRMIIITVDDKLTLAGSPGAGSGYDVSLNPSAMVSEFNRTSTANLGIGALPGGRARFEGIILTHEGLYHGLNTWHYYDQVQECDCVDAHVQPYNGGKEFSNKASKAIWGDIGIE
jgi:hypothetical protein